MKNKPLCILVDDEISALEALKDKIESLDLLEIERSFNDPDKFLVAVDSLSSQIVFLDMDMPIDGAEVAKRLKNKKVIFVSGHKESAYKAYEVDAVDFVKKPIQSFELKKAILKVLNEVRTCIVVRTQEASKEELAYDSIVLVTSNKNDSRNKDIQLQSGKIVICKGVSFEELICQLNSDFIQVNKSNIINSRYAKKMLNKDEIGLEVPYQENPVEIGLGDQYREDFFSAKPHFR
ncbi:MAG: DNA-binding LytR/AlgR family response regulator [Flavobacteriales bacterium]|jgi:DNA-binding LytR/AlgR family response regulator